MSQALVAHLILHPKISQSLKVLATTVGRDKVYRLVQYVSRLIAWYILRSGGPMAKETAMRWDGLKAGLASGRKMLRIVKPLEHLQSAVNTANTPVRSRSLTPLASPIASFAQVVRQLCYAGYLSLDMIVWLQSVKFVRLTADKHTRISKLSQRFWMYGIISSLTSSVASLVRLRAEGRRLALSRSIGSSGGVEKGGPEGVDEGQRKEEGRKLLTERATLVSQIVQDSMDFWLPATNLGYAQLNDGVIGALGAATSYMALQQQWIKVNGLPGKAR